MLRDPSTPGSGPGSPGDFIMYSDLREKSQGSPAHAGCRVCVDRGPWTANAKRQVPATVPMHRSRPVGILTAHCPLATDNCPPATNNSFRGLSQGCVHRWTSAGKTSQNRHFSPLFDSPGVAPDGEDRSASRFMPGGSDLSRGVLGIKVPRCSGTRKPPYRCSLIVHYRRQWTADQGPWTIEGCAMEEDMRKNLL